MEFGSCRSVACRCVHPESSPNTVFRVFMKALLLRHGDLISKLLSPLVGQWMDGTESSSLLITWLVPLATSPHLLTATSTLVERGLFHYYYFKFIKFSGVTLVNRTIQVSGVHSYDTWAVYCIVWLPPKVTSFSITKSLAPFPHHSLTTGHHHTVVCVNEFQFYIPCMSEIIWFLAFLDLFHLA